MRRGRGGRVVMIRPLDLRGQVPPLSEAEQQEHDITAAQYERTAAMIVDAMEKGAELARAHIAAALARQGIELHGDIVKRP